MTNYEKYFGNAILAGNSISRLVDRFDARMYDEEYHSEFTDHFEPGEDCEYGLIHMGTLINWLEKEVEE